MFYVVLLLLFFALTGAALFYFFRSNELNSQLLQASEAWRQKEEAYTSELDKLEKLRHIPDVIEKAQDEGASRSETGRSPGAGG